MGAVLLLDCCVDDDDVADWSVGAVTAEDGEVVPLLPDTLVEVDNIFVEPDASIVPSPTVFSLVDPAAGGALLLSGAFSLGERPPAGLLAAPPPKNFWNVLASLADADCDLLAVLDATGSWTRVLEGLLPWLGPSTAAVSSLSMWMLYVCPEEVWTPPAVILQGLSEDSSGDAVTLALSACSSWSRALKYMSVANWDILQLTRRQVSRGQLFKATTSTDWYFKLNYWGREGGGGL